MISTQSTITPNIIAVALENDASIFDGVSLNRSHYLTTFTQRFEKDETEKEILSEDKYWTQSIPHENSGPCETYDPPSSSDPGYESSMFLTSKELDTSLDVFLHEKNKFFYSKNPMNSKYTKYIDLEEVKKTENDHTRVIGMYFNILHICAFSNNITNIVIMH